MMLTRRGAATRSQLLKGRHRNSIPRYAGYARSHAQAAVPGRSSDIQAGWAGLTWIARAIHVDLSMWNYILLYLSR